MSKIYEIKNKGSGINYVWAPDRTIALKFAFSRLQGATSLKNLRVTKEFSIEEFKSYSPELDPKDLTEDRIGWFLKIGNSWIYCPSISIYTFKRELTIDEITSKLEELSDKALEDIEQIVKQDNPIYQIVEKELNLI